MPAWGFSDPVWLGGGLGYVAVTAGQDWVTAFLIKELLKSAGWTVPRSGTGSTYNPSGDSITSAAVMGNAGAWYEIAHPDGSGRAFSIQHVGGPGNLRAKYCDVGFGGGTPGGSQVSSHADEATIVGGGTDASPTGDANWLDINAASTPGILIGGADAAAPYGFWFAGPNFGKSGTTNHRSFVFDPVHSQPDVRDPYCVFAGYTSGSTFWSTAWLGVSGGTIKPRAWAPRSDGLTTFITMAAAFPMNHDDGAPHHVIEQVGTTEFNGDGCAYPAVYQATGGGGFGGTWRVKGCSTLIAWRGTPDNALDTWARRNGQNVISLGDCVLPWSGVQDATLGGAARGTMHVFAVDDFLPDDDEGVVPPSPAVIPRGVGGGGFGLEVD